MTSPHLQTPTGKPRARALGIPFDGMPGQWNAITDVPGVEVGYVTHIDGSAVRTGITAIHPRGRDQPADPCAAGFHSQNGQGEMTGIHWIEESGTFSGPIALSNTHAIGQGHAAIVEWTHRNHPDVSEGWLLPIVGETWDGYLNDINGGHVRVADGVTALERAATGPLDEGSVGGGTGMISYGFKAGTGTASRIVSYGDREYTVGVLVQANFGARAEFVVAGVPVGRALAEDNPVERYFAIAGAAGSVLVLVATDAPLLPNQCKALARRATNGLARTGSSGDHFSGDLFLAFSVANPNAFTQEDAALRGTAPHRLDALEFIPWGYTDPLNQAVVQATEEAVLNSLVANEDMTGIAGRRAPGLPEDKLRAILEPALHARAACLEAGAR